MEKIKLEDIEAEIERKRIRNIYISINPSTGEVGISAPARASLHTIETFFRSKLSWIRKHRTKISKRPPKIFNNYLSGEKIEVLGKKYRLNVYDYDKEAKVFLNFDSIDLYIGSEAGIEARRESIDKFYKTKLEEIISSALLKWEKKLGIHTAPNSLVFLFKNVQNKLFSRDDGIDKNAVVLRSPVKFCFKKMKGRWGSCNISDKKITLNTELAKKSERCIEYVIVHELLHLKEIKHNKRFKDYMKKAFPEWKKLEAELEGF
ncbi:MAG: M48 family metallopeptidase [Endomicrobia bacterium]|nr:M48 family metallopeptidase [Endomicrobiia bacterium]MCL2144812.1 M48 family metallopeptidase [Endomicrobiia bacterium]